MQVRLWLERLLASKTAVIFERAISWRKGLALWIASALLILVFNALKFVHLDADFPAGVTTSRALYTDEGWYSDAAISRGTGGPWYHDGELNTIVNLPVVPVLQTGVFRVLGVSFFTARGLVAAFSLVQIAAALALARRFTSARASTALALMLSVNFFLFAYSRLAVLDDVAAALAVLAMAAAAWASIGDTEASLVGGVVLGIAVLTKTTAGCALPALMYICGKRAATTRDGWRLAAIAAGATTIVVGVYSLAAWWAFPEDFQYFHQIAETFDLATGPVDLVRNFGVALFNLANVQTLAVVVVAALAWRLAPNSSSFRSNVLVRASVLWVLGFLAMISLVAYHPSRYFTAVVVPVFAIIAVGTAMLRDVVTDRRLRRLAQVAIPTLVVLVNGAQISAHVLRPSFSFDAMCHEVADILRKDGSAAQPSTLLGDMAPTVSLETGVRAISLTAAPTDLTTRLRRHCPSHYITLKDPEEAEHATVLQYYRLEHVRDWNVFGNYYRGRPVQLYKLHPHGQMLPNCRAVGD